MGGLKCRACRRFVLRRAHIVFLILVGVVAIFGLLELLSYLMPPPLKK